MLRWLVTLKSFLPTRLKKCSLLTFYCLHMWLFTVASFGWCSTNQVLFLEICFAAIIYTQSWHFIRWDWQWDGRDRSSPGGSSWTCGCITAKEPKLLQVRVVKTVNTWFYQFYVCWWARGRSTYVQPEEWEGYTNLKKKSCLLLLFIGYSCHWSWLYVLLAWLNLQYR